MAFTVSEGIESSTYFAITGAKNIIRYTKALNYVEVWYVDVPLYN